MRRGRGARRSWAGRESPLRTPCASLPRTPLLQCGLRGKPRCLRAEAGQPNAVPRPSWPLARGNLRGPSSWSFRASFPSPAVCVRVCVCWWCSPHPIGKRPAREAKEESGWEELGILRIDSNSRGGGGAPLVRLGAFAFSSLRKDWLDFVRIQAEAPIWAQVTIGALAVVQLSGAGSKSSRLGATRACVERGMWGELGNALLQACLCLLQQPAVAQPGWVDQSLFPVWLGWVH